MKASTARFGFGVFAWPDRVSVARDAAFTLSAKPQDFIH